MAWYKKEQAKLERKQAKAEEDRKRKAAEKKKLQRQAQKAKDPKGFKEKLKRWNDKH